jgi:rhodanese-related sulfurtransferase
MLNSRLHRLLFLLLVLAAPTGHTAADITADQVYAAAQSGKLRLIDIRTPDEWRRTGVAPSAARIDYYRDPQLLQSVTEAVGGDRSAPIARICHVGVRTTHAQKFLQAQGFTQVYNIREGMVGSAAGPGWIKRGLQVERCVQC